MKKKLVYLISSLFCSCILITSCSDWLDVQPIDKATEKQQFSTEAGALSALEGLYKGMVTNTLYGGNLTHTVMEAMGNAYYYESVSSNATSTAQRISLNFAKFDYAAQEGTIQSIWGSMYNLAFRVNNYLNGLEAATAPIEKGRKDLMMGEGYAIRAYLHFDLFRLFGPIYDHANLDEKYIPYNTLIPDDDNFEIDLISYGNVTAREFFDQLIKDIETAEDLMKDNDLIVTDYATAVTQELSESASKHFENRNRRLNYYAVRALKARVLQYQGKIDEAVVIAEELLAAIPWASADAPTQAGGYDFTNFYEVLFGLDNQAQYINGTSFYKQDREAFNYARTSKVHGTVFSLENDNRASHWEKGKGLTDAAGGLGFMETFRNVRYCNVYESSACLFPAGNYFQVLMRKSELMYMVAESHIAKGNYEGAVALLNEHLERRNVSVSYRLGGDNNPTLVDDKESLIAFLRMEYYREFATEGQIFFFSKRNKLTSMLDGREGRFFTIDNPTAVYSFPIPTAETEF